MYYHEFELYFYLPTKIGLQIEDVSDTALEAVSQMINKARLNWLPGSYALLP